MSDARRRLLPQLTLTPTRAELALTDLLVQLEPVRKRFFQDSYLPADTARLL